MTRDEWLELEAFIASNWQNARLQDPKAVTVRHAVVKSLDKQPALDELIRMAQAGEKWPPSPGELFAAVAATARPTAPAAGTVLGLLCEAAGTFGAARELDAVRWLASKSEHAARFAIEHGWRQFCRENLDDPSVGGAVRQRLERSIDSCTTGLEREHRENRVLPLVRDHLLRLKAGEERYRGLRQLDAAGLVPERRQLEQSTDTDLIHRSGS